VFSKNPDLDVRRWFWGDDEGGALKSIDAVDRALSLKLPDREVKFAGADRNIAASDDDRKAWQKYGNIIDWYQNQITSDPDTLNAAAGAKFKDATGKPRKYADLKPTEQDTVKGAIKDKAHAAPDTEALLIYFGVEKPNRNGEYSVSSAAAGEALQKLWDEFPQAEPMAKPNTQLVPAKR
jgi:hypothetical protein